MEKSRVGVHVFGEGIVSVTPDTLIVHLGVITDGIELESVQAKNAEAISSVIQAVLQAGVVRENIKTIDYRIEPQYRYEDGKQLFVGYRVTHIFEIKTKQIQDAGNIIDSAVKNGANSVGNIQFTIENETAFYQQALTLATHETIQKAETLARSYGVSIYRVPYLVEEQSISGPIPLAFSSFKAEAQTPIEPGKLTIQARIKAYFHLLYQ